MLAQLLDDFLGALQRLLARHRNVHAAGGGGVVSDERWSRGQGEEGSAGGQGPISRTAAAVQGAALAAPEQCKDAAEPGGGWGARSAAAAVVPSLSLSSAPRS